MIEKIEWYKEMLELEPNSRVFFPLAKMLVENNEAEEAIHILNQGLARHPDFMEARLFLIELLFRNGLQEECERQIQDLSKVFSRYAGFWQAWAACLSTMPGEADTASIVRFLAAHFLVGPLQINEVLNLGLAEIVKKKQKDDKNLLSGQSMTDESLSPDAPLQDKAAVSMEASAENIMETPAGAYIEASLQQAEEEKTPPLAAPESVGAAIDLGTLPLEEPADLAEDAIANDMIMAETPMATSPLPDAEAPVPAPEMEEDKEEFLAEIDAVPVRADGSGESFSLRTRSMAEVLADQGDYRGALEIYEELAGSGKNAEEEDAMRKRMEELRSLLNSKTPPEEAPAETSSPSQKKEKLLGILEALAKRVEARIHN